MSCQEETKKASTTQNLSSLLDVAKEDKRFNNLAYRLTNRLNHLHSSADQSDPKTHTPSLKEMLSEFTPDLEEQKEMVGEFFTALILKHLNKKEEEKDEVEQEEGEGKQTDEKDDDQPGGGGSSGGVDKQNNEGGDKEGADEPTDDVDGKDAPAVLEQSVGRDQPDKGSHQAISQHKGDDEIANKGSLATEQELSHSPPEKKVKLTNASDEKRESLLDRGSTEDEEDQQGKAAEGESL